MGRKLSSLRGQSVFCSKKSWWPKAPWPGEEPQGREAPFRGAQRRPGQGPGGGRGRPDPRSLRDMALAELLYGVACA
jgi:hypothetical protein